MKRGPTNLFFRSLTVFSGLILLLPFFGASSAFAGSLSNLSDTMTRVQISASSSHTIKFTTPTGATTSGKTIVLTFPTTFNFTSKAIASVSFTHGSTTGLETTETLASAPGASIWGAVFSGTNNSVFTLTSPTTGAALVANDKVILTYNNTNSVNPGSTGNNLISINGSFGDTGQIAVYIITADQIPVIAVVDPSVTFTVNTTALTFGGSLNTAAVNTSTGTSNMTIGTNGTNGYSVSINDIGNGTTAGLWSLNANYLIATASGTLAGGTEGYGGACNKVSGSGSCVFATAANAVTGFSLTPATFASFGSKPTGIDTYSVIVRAAISPSTTAGNYNDTLTLVGTGNF